MYEERYMSDDVVRIRGAGLSGLAAAIILAKAGKNVEVHDIREDSGARFDGDFQGLENWTSKQDFFDEMRDWGLDPQSFKSTEFRELSLIHPDDVVTTAKSHRIAYRIVERGTDEHCIDQGFKRMALDAGVTIHYKSKVDPSDCMIIAAGPKDTSAIAFGEVFKTSYPNHVAFQLNDKLAPGAYSYLIVIDGIGLICTCLWRKQKNSKRYLNETIAWYENAYPELDREPIKRVGGKGDFSIPSTYFANGQYFVGEAGGLQDFMWGFGMRYAVTSGVMAANSILSGSNYDSEIKKKLLPLIKLSATNRMLLDRVGDRGFKRLANYWMRHQKKNNGDGLVFMERIYRLGLIRRLLWPLTNRILLKKIKYSDGRTGRRMPFRKSLKRDQWEMSERAKEISSEWNEIRSSGGKVSFTESD
ncbi:MAG: hypothetical protein CMB31_07515 [Euryarchaeota archaeon]|nr:hypothetical protein [Euryarchaeota archaeon]